MQNFEPCSFNLGTPGSLKRGNKQQMSKLTEIWTITYTIVSCLTLPSIISFIKLVVNHVYEMFSSVKICLINGPIWTPRPSQSWFLQDADPAKRVLHETLSYQHAGLEKSLILKRVPCRDWNHIQMRSGFLFSQTVVTIWFQLQRTGLQ